MVWMTSRTLALAGGVLLAGATASTTADAATVLYSITGNGSGSLNGTSFTNANYSIQLTGDTTNVAACGTSCQNLGPLSQALITIDGFAPVTLTAATELGVARDVNVIFFGLNGSSDYLDFHITDAQEMAFNFLAGYGPVTGTNVFALNQFSNIASSGGALTLSQSSNVVFSSLEGAVPEAPTWMMLLLGFGAVGMTIRRARKVEAVLA